MKNIEQKALALVNEVRAERVQRQYASLARLGDAKVEALCRAIEQHESFKQEVSDEIQCLGPVVRDYLGHFIIPKPKPDPLVDVWKSIFPNGDCGNCIDADALRAALEARGLEIREKGQ